MTDRELLERAARAAGIELALPANVEMRFDELAGDFVPWNPLTDDGDALRLAVKLELDVLQRRSDPEVWVQPPMLPTVREPVGNDRAAATRRAIVRAAASMAPTQEEKQTS